MNKSTKSQQESSNRSLTQRSVSSSICPTARSVSVETASSYTSPSAIPTALSTSTATAIGATNSDFDGVGAGGGMSDTSAGSSQQNSKSSETRMAAVRADDPQALLQNLKRGNLFGRQSQSGNATNSVTNVTFANTTFVSTATSTTSESNSSMDSSLKDMPKPTMKSLQSEKSALSEKSAKGSHSSRIVNQLNKNKEKMKKNQKERDDEVKLSQASLKTKKRTTEKSERSKKSGRSGRSRKSGKSGQTEKLSASTCPQQLSVSDGLSSSRKRNRTKTEPQEKSLTTSEERKRSAASGVAKMKSKQPGATLTTMTPATKLSQNGSSKLKKASTKSSAATASSDGKSSASKRRRATRKSKESAGAVTMAPAVVAPNEKKNKSNNTSQRLDLIPKPSPHKLQNNGENYGGDGDELRTARENEKSSLDISQSMKIKPASTAVHDVERSVRLSDVVTAPSGNKYVMKPQKVPKTLGDQSQTNTKKPISTPSTYAFPGAGKCTRRMDTVAASTINEPPAHCVYDISKLSSSQRRVPSAAPTLKPVPPPTSLFGPLKKTPAPPLSVASAAIDSSTRRRNMEATAAPPFSSAAELSTLTRRENMEATAAPPASSAAELSTSTRRRKSQQEALLPTANAASRVIIFGTTPDGKNQVEFTIQMRIVSGEALGLSKEPINLVPKKVIIGEKHIPIENPKNSASDGNQKN